MISLWGLICVRHGDAHDYCWREAIQSILPVCDVVFICDGQSTDGTTDAIKEWMVREPRLQLLTFPWLNPDTHVSYAEWVNYARRYVLGDFVLLIEADEVLHEDSYEIIADFKRRRCPHEPVGLWFKRRTFWRDARSVIPHGYVCSDQLARLLPTSVWIPSDAPEPRTAEACRICELSEVVVYHYSFLRKPESFFTKTKIMNKIGHSFHHPRLLETERLYLSVPDTLKPYFNWMDALPEVEWRDKLIPFHGRHPTTITGWLEQRGWLNSTNSK